jgi:protein dithiol oxidoreductase (disulfide-forming)
MKLLKSLLLAAAVALLATGPVLAQTPVEGKQYTRVQMPQPTEQAGKVEVIEFFWYGCSHCYDFEPLLQSWVKKLPPDVSFRKVPAVFNPNWAKGARLFYTLDAMGLTERLNGAAFSAFHKERVNLNDENVLFDWVARQGVDRQKFIDMYKSFAVDGKVRKAAEMTQEYGFGGVPAVIVGGKYLLASVGTFEDLLRVTEFLIAKNRGEIKK